MSDLITWLRAQLDDDERRLTGSGDLGWLTFRQPDGTVDHTEAACRAADGVWIVAGRERTGYASAEIVHSERERLADVDAKRRILDRHTQKTGEHVTPGICAECGGSDWKPAISDALLDPFPWVMPWPCPTVRLLALPYADRDGYLDEWRP